MRVIKPSRIYEFGREYPDADASLRAWVKVARKSRWESLKDVRNIYPSADPVVVRSGRMVTVFNIGGNKYRLIVAVHYNIGKVYIVRFLTHAEYDKDQWKRQL